MLHEDEYKKLSERLETLQCVDPSAGDGLFSYVFAGEPENRKSDYENHIAKCEFCKTAIEIYRYKRHVASLLNKQ